MNPASVDFLAKIGTPTNPFPGLRPFAYEESHLFFGRNGQNQQLISKLKETRFLAVVGTSGSGKSSLVRAGLLPALYGGFMPQAGSGWRVAIMHPGDDPIGNLTRALNHTDVFGSDDAENNALQVAITEATLRRGSLGLVEAVRQANMPATENLLVVADQFEEIFRVEQGRRNEEYENDKAAFVKLLLGAKRQPDDAQTDVPIYVALTMRSDYLGDCAQFWDLPEAINEGQYLIPRLTREQRRAAITGPIAVAGGEITPRLVNRLLNDVGDNPDQLPILQHAMMRTWDEWQRKTPAHKAVHEGEAIDLCCYEAIGGMAEALSRHADEAYDEVGQVMGARGQQIAEKMFKALTEKGADNRETRRPIKLGEIRDVTNGNIAEVAAIIEIFRAPGRSFLTPPVGTPLDVNSLIDISHESLIRGWKGHENDNGEQQKRLNEWVEEEAGCARIYTRLADTAVLHHAGQAGLWRDPDLKLALIWREMNQPNPYWTRRYHPAFELAMKFLEASQRAQQEEIAERERAQQERLEQAEALAAAQRQRLEEQAKSAARLRRFAAGLVIAALLLLLAVGVAFWAYRRAETQKQLAEITSYIANLNFAQAEFNNGHVSRGIELLDAHPPRADLSSFHWYYLWHQSHNETATLKGHEAMVMAVAFAPNGRMLASGSDDRTIKLWDTQSGRALATLKGHEAAITSVAFAPDGHTLASGSWDGTVKLWDVQSQRELATLAVKADAAMAYLGSHPDSRSPWGRAPLARHGAPVWSVAFAPDGRTLASGSWDTLQPDPPSEGMIRLWDVQNRRELTTLKGHRGAVMSVAFAPDGRTIASSSRDGTIKLWDIKKERELATFVGHWATVTSVAFAPDGRTLASGSEDKRIKLWNTQNGQELATFKGHGDYVNAVAFAPDGHTLAAAIGKWTIKLWEVKSRRELATFAGHRAPVLSVAFAPDGRTLASGSVDQTVKLWDAPSERRRDVLSGHGDNVNMVAFAPDGRRLASSSGDKTIKLWDVQSGQELATLEGHEDFVGAVAFAPDGRTLASGSDDRTIKLWDTQSGRELATLKGDGDAVLSVAFAPNGGTLASGSWDGTVKLWDAKSGQELAKLTGHEAPVWSVAFARDGRTLASGSEDQTVKLWDIQSRQALTTLKAHENTVKSVAFAPDGRTLASGSWDKTIKLWDVQSGQVRVTLSGHGGAVYAVAFAPDGRTLASGSFDQMVRLWDAQSGRELAALIGHENTVKSLAFAPDGRTLASGSEDQTVRLWRGATDEQVARQRNK